jgi:hypothetical protein
VLLPSRSHSWCDLAQITINAKINQSILIPGDNRRTLGKRHIIAVQGRVWLRSQLFEIRWFLTRSPKDFFNCFDAQSDSSLREYVR